MLGDAAGHEALTSSTVLYRYLLQRLLLEFLPPETLVLDRELQSIEQDEQFVTLRFANHHVVRARVVIGCDGNQSNVRRWVIDDSPPHFLNTAVWRGQTPKGRSWPHGENFLTGIVV